MQPLQTVWTPPAVRKMGWGGSCTPGQARAYLNAMPDQERHANLSGLTLLALQLLLRGPGCSDDRMACMAEMSNWHRQQMAAVLWAAATCLRCARARVQLGWASSASIAEAPPSRGSAARCELPSQGDDR
jgi:hypothetical protein